jgi:AraC family transcriptional regulator of adaptative response / DNA-3-methyladenine glycosylase II
MALDTEHCYRAAMRRDRRFDGRFFFAVVTTGIYCRPVCPAPRPRRENVRFFPRAAAAEAAGFRPCRRCRPESAPGTPAWSGTSATVARALRLIDDGALDAGSVGALAARLGVGARHLRRLFDHELGASPVEVAATRRRHFAVELLRGTTLPVTQVALAAGFRSLRQFNHVVRDCFDRPPTALRREGTPHAPAGALTLRLGHRPPLDWSGLLAFLAPRALPGVEVVRDDGYERTAWVGGAPAHVRVTHDATGAALAVTVRGGRPAGLRDVATRVRRLFDLDADPAALAADLGADPTLRERLARRPGVRVPGAWDAFETTLRAVLGQQVSVKGATTLAGRLVAHTGTPLATPLAPGLTHLAPAPDAVAAADLSALGLPRRRQEALRAVATCAGSLDTPAALASLPGIGPWTASYVSMRCFADPDAFPESDLGLRKALARDGVVPGARDVRARAEAWRPWRAYAAMLLWLG